MNDCNKAPTSSLGLDPFKRVNYELGLVLGKDELEQEQYYFLEQGRLHNRVLHGYGTVCGLKVDIEETKVVVSAGLAVDPKGRIIRVDVDRCRDVNEWLAEHKKDLTQTSPPFNPPDRLYLVLCYQECLTDKAPVPGAACRPREESLAFSRVTESFELKLVTEPPAQGQEEAVRQIVGLLADIHISIGAPPLGNKLAAAKEQLAQRVRGIYEFTSPPLVTSPPEDLLAEVNPADAEILLRYALTIWLTEVKPKLLPGMQCALPIGEDVCVLLGELVFIVNPDTWRIEGDIALDEEMRPILVSTRLLQEYLLCRLKAELLGDVLSFGEAKKRFIQTSDEEHTYTVVAAGRFDPSQVENGYLKPLGPVHNQLTAKKTNNTGVFLLTFTGYSNPDAQGSEHTYVLKGTGEAPNSMVRIVNIKDEGLRVQVSGAQSPKFMVEITRIG